MNKKIIIIGHARHGKDTFAEFLRDIHGLSFESSSMAAARIFIFDALKEKYGYKTFEECFEDRVNHRSEWFDMITEYNREDPARLAKAIFETSDVYVGMRSDIELQKCIDDGICDVVVWVHDKRKPLESSDSFNIDCEKQFHIQIHNNGSLEQLKGLAEDWDYYLNIIFPKI